MYTLLLKFINSIQDWLKAVNTLSVNSVFKVHQQDTRLMKLLYQQETRSVLLADREQKKKTDLCFWGNRIDSEPNQNVAGQAFEGHCKYSQLVHIPCLGAWAAAISGLGWVSWALYRVVSWFLTELFSCMYHSNAERLVQPIVPGSFFYAVSRVRKLVNGTKIFISLCVCLCVCFVIVCLLVWYARLLFSHSESKDGSGQSMQEKCLRVCKRKA